MAFKIPQRISKYLSDPVFLIYTAEFIFFEMNFELCMYIYSNKQNDEIRVKIL